MVATLEVGMVTGLVASIFVLVLVSFSAFALLDEALVAALAALASFTAVVGIVSFKFT